MPRVAGESCLRGAADSPGLSPGLLLVPVTCVGWLSNEASARRISLGCAWLANGLQRANRRVARCGWLVSERRLAAAMIPT